MSGPKAYLAALAATVLFPIQWARSLRAARDASDDVPEARRWVSLGIVASVVLAAAGGLFLYTFAESSEEGMYSQLDTRLRQAVGEQKFQDTQTELESDQSALSITRGVLEDTRAERDRAQQNLTDLQAAGAPEDEVAAANETLAEVQERVETLEVTVEETETAIETSENTIEALRQNHRFYEETLAPLIEARDDPAIREAIADAGFRYQDDDGEPLFGPPVAPELQGGWDRGEMLDGTDAALAIKDDAWSDMWKVYGWLLLPGLIGVFYAPLVYAQGKVVNALWEPSQSVGYKPYPNVSMAWFLLLGGFGWPALLLGAWTFKDLHERQDEGQISL